MLKFVTKRQLCGETGACVVAADRIDPSLDGKSVALSRDGKTGFHEVTAIIGRVLAHRVTVKRPAALDPGIAE